MSTLRVDTIQNAAGTDSPINVPGTAKAWVNFNGTGTVAIRASYNVSSITDNGTGDYTVNFTSALADANYALAGNCKEDSTGATAGDRVLTVYRNAFTTSACRVNIRSLANNAQDVAEVYVTIFR